MKNKVFFVGMFCIALVFGIMISGCTPEVTKRITYRVSGHLGTAELKKITCRINYIDEYGGKNYIDNAVLPWEKTISVQGKAGDLFGASIGADTYHYNHPISGTESYFTVTISVDGSLVAMNSSNDFVTGYATINF